MAKRKRSTAPESVVIRIQRDTFDRLKAYAQPFVSTPDSVIRALLDAADDADLILLPMPGSKRP